ncbi:MAG TPA: hypothetical protein PLJ34_00445 [Hyphomicrobiales bacterium]|nr:hypothetical protein [Hyphomicrobiales bacterium]
MAAHCREIGCSIAFPSGIIGGKQATSANLSPGLARKRKRGACRSAFERRLSPWASGLPSALAASPMLPDAVALPATTNDAWSFRTMLNLSIALGN